MRPLEQIIKSNEELSKLKQQERQPWPFPQATPPPVSIDPADPAEEK